MNEQEIYLDFGFKTTRKFSKKYKIPEHLVRSMVKRGELPGFYSGNRFNINERLALKRLDEMSISGTTECR